MKREYDVLRIYNSLFITSSFFIFATDVITKHFNGSMPANLFNPSTGVLIIGLVVQIVPLLLIYPIFIKTKDLRLKTSHKAKIVWYFDEKKIHWFIFFIMLLNFAFSLKTGVGKADSSNRTSLSFLLRILPPEPLMLLYFVFSHSTRKKVIFWINFILFGAYRIVTGWTGFIIEYAFIELFLFVKHTNRIRSTFPLLKFGILCDAILVLIGGVMYSFLRPLKFAIRYGYMYSGRNSFVEGISNLISRLTNYEATVVSIINHSKIAQIYVDQGVWYWEALSAFKNVIPRFIMPIKDYRVLGNILMNSYYPDISSTTSTGYSIITYAWNLIEASFSGFLFWVALYCILFIICKEIVQRFDDNTGDSDVLYFILIMEVLQGTPINVSLGTSYLELLYALILLPFFGIIKRKF